MTENLNRLPLIGDKAPAFQALTTNGTVNFPDDYKGSWVLFFSHPSDFTPVCTTEFMTMASMKEEFQKMIAEDGLREWAEGYGNYYGTPAQKVRDSLAEGKNILLEIDTQGAALVREKFPEGVYIYILPPSLEELKRRIIGRGTDSAESIERRLSCAREEMGCASEQYNYLVLNDEVELAVERVETIIEAEQYQIKRNLNLLKAVCGE